MGIIQVIMIIVALITIGVGVAVKQDMPKANPQVLTDADNYLATPLTTILPTTLPVPIVTPFSTIKPTPTPPAPSPSDSLIYPGASIVTIAGNTTKLTSTAQPEEIFKWYQNQIKALGFSATSIAKTNTNNNFLASLSSAENQTHIDIKIERKSGAQVTTVEIASKQ